MSTLTVQELGAVLAGPLVEQGLQIQPVDLARAEAVLGGPLLAVRLPTRPGSGAEVGVVVVDRSGDASAEQLVQSLAHAVAAPVQHLLDGDASLDALPALEQVLASFDAPVEAAVIIRAGAPVGALLWAVDRRQAAPAGAAMATPGAVRDDDLSLAGTVPPAVLSSFGQAPVGMALLKDVHLDVSVELGRTDMTVAEVLELAVGAVVELDRAARAPVDIRVNGTLLARGEVVVVDDEYAVRVTEIVDPTSGLGS